MAQRHRSDGVDTAAGHSTGRRVPRGKLLRHTMATLMHENGADIRHIQAILGHEDIRTTQIYTQVAIRALQQIHAATHPAESHTVPSPAERSAAEREGLHAALAAEDDNDSD